MKAYEANFDGLVGPTHNYAGLSHGNVASVKHRSLVSNPREAALQGLDKMKRLADLGLAQGVLPPQERPAIHVLRRLGFDGKTDARVLEQASKEPSILAACSSASSMWTANAATVSPSADSRDRKVHFTPANLNNKFHRAIEPETTSRVLKAIFKNPRHFVHHEALPGTPHFGDEGAANHTRFCGDYGKPGLQFFVYGRKAFEQGSEPKKFPARQTLEASQAIARLHQLREDRTFFAQQNPEVIDSGVFHNDVISVGSGDVLFTHEDAFVEQARVLGDLRERFLRACGRELRIVSVGRTEVPVSECVSSYLFNTQLLRAMDGSMFLLAPEECKETPSVHSYLGKMVGESSSPIRNVEYMDLRQSMQNGGGPACLRLRVVLSESEKKAVRPGVWMNAKLYERLKKWINKNYRDRIAPEDLRDPALLKESRKALDELTGILGIGSVYVFQK